MSGVEERLADDPTAELWGEHRSRYRFALQAIQQTDRVLDVACGSGFGLRMIADAGNDAIGVDYDARALAGIKQSRGEMALVRADATCLPLSDASFDMVVSFETIEHVYDADKLVAEFRRVLKPGGRLVLSTPNRAFGPPERHTSNPFHIREFTAQELRQLINRRFQDVRLFGQRPSNAYHYVPFLMVEPHNELTAIIWKVLTRLPFHIKNRIAFAVSGRSFYPGEADYCFDPENTDGAHALVAVAR